MTDVKAAIGDEHFISHEVRDLMWRGFSCAVRSVVTRRIFAS
jgi:hypothetical protein